MRSHTPHGRLMRLFLLSALVLPVSGCGDKPLPDSPYNGASRDLMENPLGASAKLKGAEEEKAKSKTKGKMSAKVAAARAKAASVDPRSK